MKVYFEIVNPEIFSRILFFANTRGVQKIRGQMLPFLYWLSNRAGITAHNTVTYMQLIGYNMLGVSRLRELQLSSRQRYVA